MTTTNSVQFPGEAGTSVPQQPARLAESTAPVRRQSTLRKLKEAAKSLLPTPVFLSLLHHKEIGRYPNLLRPTTFNEKILQKSLRPRLPAGPRQFTNLIVVSRSITATEPSSSAGRPAPQAAGPSASRPDHWLRAFEFLVHSMNVKR